MSIINTPLTDIYAAKNIGKMLFNQYSNQKSELTQQDIKNLFMDTNSLLNQQNNSNTDEINGLKYVLDKNHDQRVTLEDFEELAIEFLTQSVGSSSTNSNSNLYYSQQQTSAYSSSEKPKNNDNYRNQIETYNSSPKNDNNEQYEETIEYGPNGEKIVTKKKIVQTVHTTHQTTLISSQNQGLQRQQTITQESEITEEMNQKLKKAKQMFDRFANEDGVITEEEIEPLIIGTQQSMGITNYKPTEQEIQEWLKEVDQNDDGEISWDEYKFVILNSIQKSSNY